MHDLDRLACLVDELAAEHPRTALPLLVWCRHPIDEARVEVLPLEGDHPADVLLGACAPEGTGAVGVCATGWSVPVAGGRAERVPVRTTVLVAAGGACAGRLAIDGRAPVPAGPGAGLVVDLLRRSLGCATEPPAMPLEGLLARAWLAQLAAADATASWPELAEVHLALQVCPDAGADELPDVAVRVAGELGWAGMRRVVAAGGWPGVCAPEVAAWFDDGGFARFAVGAFPPLTELLDAAAAGRPPAVAARIRAAAAAWQLE